MFSDRVLAGKKILITGEGSSIGKSLGTRFLELGAEIVICGRREAVLQGTVAEWTTSGGRASYLVCDVRLPDEIDAMFNEIWVDRSLDGLVNNSAGNFIARTETLSPTPSTPSSTAMGNSERSRRVPRGRLCRIRRFGSGKFLTRAELAAARARKAVKRDYHDLEAIARGLGVSRNAVLGARVVQARRASHVPTPCLASLGLVFERHAHHDVEGRAVRS